MLRAAPVLSNGSTRESALKPIKGERAGRKRPAQPHQVFKPKSSKAATQRSEAFNVLFPHLHGQHITVSVHEKASPPRSGSSPPESFESETSFWDKSLLVRVHTVTTAEEFSLGQGEKVHRSGGEDEEARWDIVHPNSPKRYYWDMATLFFMAWVIIDIPFIVAFEVEENEEWGWHEVIMQIVDCFFMFDVFLNFNTGIEANGRVSLNRIDIAKDYLKGWFWVDIVSAFPLASQVVLQQPPL